MRQHLLVRTRGSRGRFTAITLVVALLCLSVGPVSAIAVSPLALVTETEPNNDWTTANALVADGTIMNGTYTAGDEDWYSVSVTGGVTYRFEMGPNMSFLDVMPDTWLELWNDGATVKLADNDDSGVHALYSLIVYTPPTDTTLYVMTRHLDASGGTGPYGLRVYPQLADATISGAVTGGGGALEGIEVRDWFYDPWYSEWDFAWAAIISTNTDVDGLYTMDVPAGTHRVEFFDPSFEYLGEFWDDVLSRGAADDVVVADGETAENIDAELAIMPPPATRVTDTMRASTDAEGVQGVDADENARGSIMGHISSTGRYVVFYTGNGLVPEDTNGHIATHRGQDWYLKDTQTDGVSLVTVALEGQQSNSSRPNDTQGAAVSANGRYVAFADFSSNLVEGDTNGLSDVFYRDMQLGTTVRISVDEGGGEADYGSRSPAISDDGRYVAFRSGEALVEDDTNGNTDIYVRDMVAGTIERVSVATDGTEGDDYCDDPEISADGRYVVFQSDSTNLVAGDTNGEGDVFVHDRTTGVTARVSLGADAAEADNSSWQPSISADGRYVAFESGADNLVADDTNDDNDVFVRDRQSGTTVCVSVDADGNVDDGGGWSPDISANGRFVTFVSGGTSRPGPTSAALTSLKKKGLVKPADVVPGDVNGQDDVFVRDMAAGKTTFVSVTPDKGLADDDSWDPQIDADGLKIVYDSDASDLVDDDTNDATDVFVAALESGEDLRPVYRFYNMRTGVHFWTASEDEKAVVLAVSSATMRLEGIAYYVNVANPDNDAPLYRFFNKRNGAHFYTANEAERAMLQASFGYLYRFEGVAHTVSSAGGAPVYRFYRRWNGDHFYTASEVEKNTCLTLFAPMFRSEGIGFWLAP